MTGVLRDRIQLDVLTLHRSTAAALALEDVDVVEIHCDEANVRSRRVPERLDSRLDRVEDDEVVVAPAEVGRSMIWAFPV